MIETILVASAVLFLLLGLWGTFLPVLPGPPLAWVGLYIIARQGEFQEISSTVVIVLLVAAIIVQFIDTLAPLVGAKKFNASKKGLLGATIGLIVGMFTLGPVGIVLGPLVGAFVGEMVAGKKGEEAGNAALGTFAGFLLGTVLKLVVVVTMIGYVIVAFV